MGVVIAATAEKERVTAGFEAALVVTAFGARGALETNGILFLELVGGGGDTLAFPLLFLLVTRVKAASSASGTLTSISTLEEEVGQG